MAKGDTKTNQYLDIAANGTRADLPTDTCCETRSQTLIREVAERIMDVEDEVEELKNNPDVVDIVATYADLQAYDTQHLTDKDIIRVLQDETHDGESTYYRYNKQSDTWTYVGTVGDYYTKTAADAKFQDKLTAGSNITISNQNVISATDTTYSDFTGTDGTAAGEAGLVPAPATTDTDKYLKSDGTWAEVQGGGGGTNNFNQLTNRPSYDNTTMTGSTSIPKVPTTTSELTNDSGFITSSALPTVNDATLTITQNGTSKGTFTANDADDTTIALTDTTYSAGSGLDLTGTEFSVDTTTIQPKLTAGSNVTIDANNEISATDTTYSNFTGTDGTAAGMAGLVPAPATTDVGKFLKADGTWDDAAGGGGSVTELTSADYNWHSSGNVDNLIALWLLDDGIYKVPADISTKIRVYSSETAVNHEGLFIVSTINSQLTSPEKMIYDMTRYTQTSDGSKLAFYYVNENGAIFTKGHFLTPDDIINNLTTTDTAKALSATQGKALKDLVDSLAIRGVGAPATTTAGQVGTLYEDTTNGDLYICTDATNPYVWEEVGAGGGSITPVQTPGDSTTDVMSQNAVTSMIFADPATQRKIKVGSGASSTEGADAIEIGRNTSATGSYSVALGGNARANSTYAVSLGQSSGDSSTSYEGAVSFGRDSHARANGAIALGISSGYTGMAAGEMHIGTSNTAYGYNNSNYRLLTGLYDGQSAHDAATVGQITPLSDSSAPTTATVGRLGQIFIDTTNADAYMCVAVDSVTPTYSWKKITA